MIRHTAFGLIAIATASSAVAAGAWVDKFGRHTTMQFPGVDQTALQVGNRTASEVSAAFKRVCLDTHLDRAASGAAAEALGWQMTYRPAVVPFKEAVDIGGWRTNDAEVYVGKDMFFAKGIQCNLSVASTAFQDRAAVIGVLAAVVGQPANAAKATKKDGSLNRGWQPEWSVNVNGAVARVYLLQPQPNEIHLAALIPGQ